MLMAMGRRSKTPRVRLALDIGTEYTKALVVSVGPEPTILGVGRAKQSVGDMEDGSVAHITGVVACCRRAIEKACSLAGHTPLEAVVGVAGANVRGSIHKTLIRRRFPRRPITAAEFRKVLSRANKEAAQRASETMAEQTGLPAVAVRLLHATLLEVKIDGQRVRSPLQFCGTYVELSMLHAFSPIMQFGALERIASELGIVIVQAVAEPFAVAAGVLGTTAHFPDAVIIDVGGGSTDVAVIRQGHVSDTRSLPVGGRSFTRSLARYFGLDMDEAESMKLDYGAGLLDESLVRAVDDIFAEDIKIFVDALSIGLGDLAQGHPLPHNLFLCGGGAHLPGLQESLASAAWGDLFAGKPHVHLLDPTHMKVPFDPDLHLSGLGDVTPKCLALQAARFGMDAGEDLYGAGLLDPIERSG